MDQILDKGSFKNHVVSQGGGGGFVKKLRKTHRERRGQAKTTWLFLMKKMLF